MITITNDDPRYNSVACVCISALLRRFGIFSEIMESCRDSNCTFDDYVAEFPNQRDGIYPHTYIAVCSVVFSLEAKFTSRGKWEYYFENDEEVTLFLLKWSQ